MPTETTPPVDVCVVGGGLVGLCAAFFLQRAGLRVHVVEKAHLGSGAGRHNAGMIVRAAKPMPAPGMVGDGLRHMFGDTGAFYVDPRRLLSILPFLTRFAWNSRPRRYAEGVQTLSVLNERIGETFDLLQDAGAADRIDKSGVVFAFARREPAEAMHARATASARLGVVPPNPVWSGGELRERVPILGDAARWAVQLPSVWWVDPVRFMERLVGYVRDHDIGVSEHREALALREQPHGVEVVTTGETIRADRVLVCAGAWTQQLTRTAGVRTPVVPGTGYSFSVDTAGMRASASVSFPDVHVVSVPVGSQRLRLAGTMEFDGLDSGTSERRVSTIIEQVRPYLSAEIDWRARADVWSGPRPMTADGLPHLGPVNDTGRLFVAAGHNMEGLTLGPATGSVMADLMTGKLDASALSGFRPDRRWT